MKLSSYQSRSSASLLLIIGLMHQMANSINSTSSESSAAQQGRLIDKCCQVGKERAIRSQKFNCKLSAREALVSSSTSAATTSAESLLAREPSFGDQCEMVLESCCMAHHRTRNCDSGKQFAKSGAACMDVELSKEANIATESFNDCCMSCSLGILAAKNPAANETIISSRPSFNQQNLAQRCKLISPLASSLSGQLYEQTYIECCQENLPRLSSALVEPGAQIDCAQSNPCAQRCIAAGNFDSSRAARRLLHDKDRCECFAGYKLASDGVNCVDVDECKLNTHSCNKQSEVCDNTRGSFRCLARQTTSSHLIHSPTFGRSSFLVSDSSASPSLADDDSGGEFISMRLCPLGTRWNANENRCITTETHHQHKHHQQQQQQQQHSGSIFSSSFGVFHHPSERTSNFYNEYEKRSHGNQ